MEYQRFYSELGKLLYAIADIDGKVTKQEAKKIHEIVEKRLVPTEKHKDRFGSNAAFYTEIEFDYLENEIADPETALDSFVDYLEEHHTAFNDEVLDDCLSVAKDVALAYQGITHKETALITKLENKLKKIKTSNRK